MGGFTTFMEGFDYSFSILKILEMLLSKKLSVFIYTDSKQLIRAMTKGNHTTKRRLIIKIMAAKQAYPKLKIAKLALASEHTNPADILSKVNDN